MIKKAICLSMLLIVPIQGQWPRSPGYQQRVWTDVTASIAVATATIAIWELMRRHNDKPTKPLVLQNCAEFQDKNGYRIFRCEDPNGAVTYLEMR